MDLDAARLVHPRDSVVTLHRVIPPKGGTKADRLAHEEMLAPHLGQRGIVRGWCHGTRGPQVLARFGDDLVWLEMGEIADE